MSVPNVGVPLPGTFAVYPEGHQHAGQDMTREVECRCGRVFLQRLLSTLFLKWCETLGGQHAVAAVDHSTRGGWVPVECPRCERIALARGHDVPAAPARMIPPPASKNWWAR